MGSQVEILSKSGELSTDMLRCKILSKSGELSTRGRESGVADWHATGKLCLKFGKKF